MSTTGSGNVPMGQHREFQGLSLSHLAVTHLGGLSIQGKYPTTGGCCICYPPLVGAEVAGKSRSGKGGAGDKSSQEVVKQGERKEVFQSLQRTAA